MNIGSAFFGWLVAVGMGAILTALITAAGAAIGLSTGGDVDTAAAIGIGGAILLLVVIFVAYFCGGYVAGRMSRFDGARQGVAVWIVSVVMALLFAALSAVAGAEYNVLADLNLPRVPVDEGAVAAAGWISLLLLLIVSLLGAALGGRVGESYHERVDAEAYRS